MGKTASGAVWLDPAKTSPYDFFQYWRNVGDDDVLKCIRMLTFLPLEQIDEMDSWEGSQLNHAKEILAYELTKLVHGEEEAEKALETSRQIFAQGTVSVNMPTTVLSFSDFNEGKIAVSDMLVKSALAPSKGEAKRLIQQGGIMLGDIKVLDFSYTVDISAFENDVIIKKGKKVYHRFLLEK